METCKLCLKKARVKTKTTLYSCVLCGAKRCGDHTIWVPASEFDREMDTAAAARLLFKSEPIGGWLPFCEHIAHVPQGVSKRLGADKTSGAIVEKIPVHERPSGIDIFPMWQTGVVEAGKEKKWETNRFEASCQFWKTLVLAVRTAGRTEWKDVSATALYDRLVCNSANMNSLFFTMKCEEFESLLGDSPTLWKLMSTICSRCGATVCLNRLAPFHDQRVFSKLIREPNSVIRQH
ncbi:MAG: hypothetical protein HXY34_09270 [Candidatus Thorarchaeota archaeon]|nr:hypothetical protein [Candidatus Thorarchaeota archaeon]